MFAQILNIKKFCLTQSEPGSDGNEGVLRIPQSITGASPSDCLVSYQEHSLGESYSTAEMQLKYSTAPADWARRLYHCCYYRKALFMTSQFGKWMHFFLFGKSLWSISTFKSDTISLCSWANCNIAKNTHYCRVRLISIAIPPTSTSDAFGAHSIKYGK